MKITLGQKFCRGALALAAAGLLVCISACAKPMAGTDTKPSERPQKESLSEENLKEMTVDALDFEYANQVKVDILEGGCELVTVASGDRYLLVADGNVPPEGLNDDIIRIDVPIENGYLAASAVMDMFRHLDAVDSIRLSGTKEEDWEIAEAKSRMQEGGLIYAGKYSAPDYELILDENCGLVIENTMINHSPEVKEQFANIGVPVFVDYSSYESHPLGRSEWIKVYGELTGKREAAEAAYEEQKAALAEVEEALKDEDEDETKDRRTAFFFITTNGAANIRKSSDYVPKMIALAGGSYAFDNPGDEDNHSSSETIQMESFYDTARDADYLIYNSTIDGEIETIEDLLAKSPLFQEFKAVHTGQVYCTRKNFYQESMAAGGFIRDLHEMYKGGETMDYLYRLK